jgi:carbamoylphosphate synthase small subunit
MIIGHAAGLAAKMAIATNKPVQEIDTKALTRRLIEQGAVMEYVPSAQNRALAIFRKSLGVRR